MAEGFVKLSQDIKWQKHNNSPHISPSLFILIYLSWYIYFSTFFHRFHLLLCLSVLDIILVLVVLYLTLVSLCPHVLSVL